MYPDIQLSGYSDIVNVINRYIYSKIKRDGCWKVKDINKIKNVDDITEINKEYYQRNR